jgi:hypothetical protein
VCFSSGQAYDRRPRISEPAWMETQLQVPLMTTGDDEKEEQRPRLDLGARCIRKTPLHCTFLKWQSCGQGLATKVGRNFHERLCKARPVSKLTVVHEYKYCNIARFISLLF